MISLFKENLYRKNDTSILIKYLLFSDIREEFSFPRIKPRIEGDGTDDRWTVRLP